MVYKEITLRDAIYYIDFAWNKIGESTILNCFRHAKWISNQDVHQIMNINIESYDDIIEKMKITDPLTIEEYIEFQYTENDELIEFFQKENNEGELINLENPEEFEEPKEIQAIDIFKGLENIKKYLQFFK